MNKIIIKYKLNTILFLTVTFAVLALLWPGNSALSSESYNDSLSGAYSYYVFDSETNNSDALDIAKSLDPEFFAIDPVFEKNAEFYAQYLDLDSSNPERFLAYTIKNSTFYCTRFGCPFYIYEKEEEQQEWEMALSIEAFRIGKNLSSDSNNEIQDIITENSDKLDLVIRTWSWNGSFYEKK